MGKVSTVNKTLCKKCHLFRKKKINGPPETAVGTWESLFHSEVFFVSLQMGAWKIRYFDFPCIQSVQEDFRLKAQATTNHAINPSSLGSWRLPCRLLFSSECPGLFERARGSLLQPFRTWKNLERQVLCWEEAMEEYREVGKGWVLNLEEKALYSCPTALCVRSLKIASQS